MGSEGGGGGRLAYGYDTCPLPWYLVPKTNQGDASIRPKTHPTEDSPICPLAVGDKHEPTKTYVSRK